MDEPGLPDIEKDLKRSLREALDELETGARDAFRETLGPHKNELQRLRDTARRWAKTLDSLLADLEE